MKLIEFQADWCGPCKQQEPIVEELVEARDDVDLEVVDVEENSEKASQYSVRSLPTIVVETDDGTRVKQFVGLTQRGDIEEALDEAA